MADLINTDCRPSQQYRGSFQQLADARRVLKVTNSLRSAPVLSADDRLELEKIRALAIRTIEAATEARIATRRRASRRLFATSRGPLPLSPPPQAVARRSGQVEVSAPRIVVIGTTVRIIAQDYAKLDIRRRQSFAWPENAQAYAKQLSD